MKFVELTADNEQKYLLNIADIVMVEPMENDWNKGCYVTIRNGATRFNGLHLRPDETKYLLDVIARVNQ